MNPDIVKMIKYQTVWDGIIRAEKEIDESSKNIRNIEKELADLLKKFDTLNDNIKKQKSDLKTREIKFDELSSKIKELNDKRLSATNEKQLKAFDNEISVLTEEADNIEEFIINQLDVVEKDENDLSDLDSEVKNAKNESDENMKMLAERIERFAESKASKEEEFNKGLMELSPQAKSKFQKLVTSANKKGIVELKNSICMGCNTKVPESDVSKIKGNKDLVNCQNCGKYLYFDMESK